MKMETVTETYKVKTPVFEGPMDLLLNLIEARKLFINEISLAEVADDYIAHVKNLPQFEIGSVTSFILIAATLILIKSKSLLPNLKLTDEEGGQIQDLERRLRLYQLVKESSITIKNKFGKRVIFGRPESAEWGPVFSPDGAITIERMLLAAREVIGSLPKKEFLPEVVVRKVISIEEMINSLTERVQTSLKMSFSDFSASSSSDAKEKKVYVIVSFLAMLELVRGGIIEALQGDNFEEIQIEKLTDGSSEHISEKHA